MKPDNWSPFTIDMRDSTRELLDQLFNALRASVGLGEVMSDRECFEQILLAVIPFIQKRLRQSDGQTSELSFHTNEELINELKKRFLALVIVGEIKPVQGYTHTHVQNGGSRSHAIGLCEYAKGVFLRALLDEVPTKPAPPDMKVTG